MALRSPALDARAVPRPTPSDDTTKFARDDWETPPALFRAYNGLYHFTIDVAANGKNTCCTRYLDTEQDGLSKSWRGHVVWLHPPHSNPGPWVSKARREAQAGVTVVALVPADVAADWWHRDVMPFASVRFLQGVPQFRLHRLPITEKSRRQLPTTPFAVLVFRPGRTL